jgi:O-antigen/teichoic acid export membrane protein
MPPMSLKRRIVTSLIWSFTGSWSREVLNFVVFLLLSRLLGPEVYGLLGMAMALTAVAQALVVEGFSGFIVQQRNLHPKHLDMVFWLSVSLGVAMATLMVVAAPAIAAFFGRPDVADLVRAVAVLPLLFALSTVPEQLLKRDFAFRVLSLRGLLASVVGGGIGLTMALTGYGVWSLIVMQIVQWLVQVVVLWSCSSWRPSLRFSTEHLRDLCSFAFYALAIRSIMVVETQVLRVVIGYFLGPMALGLYMMAWRIIEVLGILLIVPISQVALSAFAQLQTHRDHLGAALKSMIEVSTLLAFPSYVGLMTVAPELVGTLFGPRWTDAIPILQIVSGLGIMWPFSYCFNSLLVGTRAMGWRTLIAVTGLATLAVILPVCVPFGLAAICVGVVLRSVLILLLACHVVRQALSIRMAPVLRSATPAALATAGMAALIVGWHELMGARLGMPALLGSSVALAVVAFAALALLVARSIVTRMLRSVLELRPAEPPPAAWTGR